MVQERKRRAAGPCKPTSVMPRGETLLLIAPK